VTPVYVPRTTTPTPPTTTTAKQCILGLIC
jgi:hypothetical protein